jgi:palmitoyl-protein thioesterase
MRTASNLVAVGLLASGCLGSVQPRPVQNLWRTRSSKGDNSDSDNPLPLVIWHGLGDSWNSEGIKEVAELADEINPGTYTVPIYFNSDPNADRRDTFFGNVTDFVDAACHLIAADPILSTAPAIDAIGFSQGGQFLRAYVERCNKPPVRSLVTFGSQHNGIIDFRACDSGDWLCRSAMALLRFNTWSSIVQSRLVPAQYYRDPRTEQDYEAYLEHSNFLADINNERQLKNVTYKKNIAALENFVMYMFEDDTVAIPKETAWFEEVNGTEVIPLRARDLYREDWLGLRELDRKGGLVFKTIPGQHMSITEEVLRETIHKYFGPYRRRSYNRPQAPVVSEERVLGEL